MHLMAKEPQEHRDPDDFRDLGPNAPTAQRMRRLRELMVSRGVVKNQAGFARFIGTLPSQLNMIEKGMPISKSVAFSIVKKIPGVTLEWLWFGESRGLTVEMCAQLESDTPLRGNSTTS